ncbi:MAG: FAD-binding oxidoreductase [Chitinophagaceae bacterium]|nr:FAD-binding oxidoreductase [Chitinophagaceae bacterium]
MDLRSGYPLSLIRNGIPFDYPKLEQDLRADVAVIGAGISGALTAYYLQQAGLDTVVIDGRTAGLGSTCASTSLLLYEIDKPLHQLREQAGRHVADRVYELSRDSVEGLGKLAGRIGFRNFHWADSLYIASAGKRRFLEAEYSARRSLGLNVAWLDESGLMELYGVKGEAAIVSAGAARTDAYEFAHAVHQHNLSQGVRIFDRTAMGGFDIGRTDTRIVTTAGHLIRAKHLVFANGYEALESLGKGLATVHSTYVTASEQLTPEKLGKMQDFVLWDTAEPYHYIRSTSDNRILIGGRDEPFYSPARRDRLLNRKAALLERDFQKMIPGVPFTREFNWTGSFVSSADGLPYIGMHPGLKRCYFALGFGGNGINFAYLAAKLVAGLIAGKSGKDLALFSFNRR